MIRQNLETASWHLVDTHVTENIPNKGGRGERVTQFLVLPLSSEVSIQGSIYLALSFLPIQTPHIHRSEQPNPLLH